MAQIYGVFAQLPVSPVAYLPAESLAAGYRVIAELSTGWRGATLPFVREQAWEIRREVVYPKGAALYIEGVLGEIAVWQGTRLLFVGRQPWVWVPLVGAGRAELLLSGSNGGIGGGIYLLAQADTLGWPAEPWPSESLRPCAGQVPSTTMEEVLSIEALREVGAAGACIAVPSLPPARVRRALSKEKCLCQGKPSAPKARVESFSPVLLVALLGVIGGASWLFPALGSIRWRGFFSPLPVNFLEAAVGLVVALLVSWGVLGTADVRLWVLFWVYLGVEGAFLSAQGLSLHWAWQSWEGLWLLGLGVRLLRPEAFWIVAGVAWLLRAGWITLRVPSFAYLCLAEYFFYLLLLFS